MEQYCSLNGELLPLHQARLQLPDRGFLYGDGLFETMRIYRGHPFSLERHLQRLLEGAAFLGIEVPGGKDRLAKEVNALINASKVEEGSLRLTLTRGEAKGALWPEDKDLKSISPTVFITINSRITYMPEQYNRGFKAVYISFPRNERSPVTGIKSLNFLENILGKGEASAKGVDEGLFLNTKGALTEGTVSNLFLVIDEAILTPPLDSGILPGITREVIIKILRKGGIEVKEGELYPRDMLKASESFLTNSLVEVMPLTEVDGRPIGSGKPGKVTSKIARLYKEHIQ